MSPNLATLAFTLGILTLFFLNRDKEARTSKALWLPVVWLCIAGSRMVSEWMAPTAVSTSVTGSRYLDGSLFDRNLLTILLLIGVVVLLLRGARVWSILRANWPILLFFFYCLLSIAWSDFPDVAFKRWVKALGDVVMVLVVLTDVNPSAAIRRFLARVGFVLIPVSILFIKYYPDFGRAYGTRSYVAFYSYETSRRRHPQEGAAPVRGRSSRDGVLAPVYGQLRYILVLLPHGWDINFGYQLGLGPSNASVGACTCIRHGGRFLICSVLWFWRGPSRNSGKELDSHRPHGYLEPGSKHGREPVLGDWF